MNSETRTVAHVDLAAIVLNEQADSIDNLTRERNVARQQMFIARDACRKFYKHWQYSTFHESLPVFVDDLAEYPWLNEMDINDELLSM